MNTRMMTLTRRTGALATILAIFALMFGVSPAHALADEYAIAIHKFEQPEAFGDVATGLPIATDGLTPVAGATFRATRVPGIDLTTNAGQYEAGLLTLEEAADRIAGQATAYEATTNADGDATIAHLVSGLYYVVESFVPAGFAGAAPFFVALPLTDPVQLDSRINTVHVYPKNASASITLQVHDADAIVLGDTVHWVSTSTVPNASIIDGYLVEQIIDPKLEYTGTPVVRVDGVGTLTPENDYTVRYDPETRTVAFELTENGLRKLEQAVANNPNVTVVIEYDTIVHAEGELVNKAVLYPSQNAIDERRGVHDTDVTKWGPLSVVVHEHGNPANLIADACFMVYATEADARAGVNPITVDGVAQWVTDAAGRFIVPGLRFSDFANGFDRDVTDPLYRLYWAVPVCVPDGWNWVNQDPLAGVVNDVLEFQTLIFEVEQKAGDEPDLPVTGAQIAGLGVLGAALGAAGVFALLARKRNKPDSLIESEDA